MHAAVKHDVTAVDGDQHARPPDICGPEDKRGVLNPSCASTAGDTAFYTLAGAEGDDLDLHGGRPTCSPRHALLC